MDRLAFDGLSRLARMENYASGIAQVEFIDESAFLASSVASARRIGDAQ
jgi:hypothetical protein